MIPVIPVLFRQLPNWPLFLPQTNKNNNNNEKTLWKMAMQLLSQNLPYVCRGSARMYISVEFSFRKLKEVGLHFGKFSCSFLVGVYHHSHSKFSEYQKVLVNLLFSCWLEGIPLIYQREVFPYCSLVACGGNILPERQ